MTTVEPKGVVRGVEVAERDGRRATGLRQASQGRVGDLPGLGQVKSEEVIRYVSLVMLIIIGRKDHSLHVSDFCCASVVVRKPYMYNVPFTTAL